MTADDAVLNALRTALAADPSQHGVRRHLTELLLQAGRATEALAEARQVLAAEPADPAALALAAKAAERSGEADAAAGYRRLLAALGEPAEAESGEEPEPETAVPEATTSEGRAPPETRLPEATAPTTSASPASDDAAAEAAPSEAVTAHVGGDNVVRFEVLRGGDEGVDEEDGLEVEAPSIRLADVAGLAEVKRRIELSFLAPMRNPELRAAYRKSLRGGLLLYGPPGCGKTFIARAMAGELSARFVAVELSDVLDMWLGQSEKNLHELFELARRNAPCVLFIDEIDALGRSRSLMRHNSAMSGVVNQFLAEMDGAGRRNEGVYVLAATNQPWDVDPALRRPGRLDRTLLVLPPDREAREHILRFHLRDRPVDDGIDLQRIARQTEEFSGADLAHLCEVATELAMEDSAAKGEVRPIVQSDLKRARKEVRPSIRPWLETARNYALFANEGGAYDDLVAYLRQRKIG